MKLCLFVVCALGAAILPQTEGKTYYFEQTLKTWMAAYNYCASMERTLASISSLEDQIAIESMLSNAGEKNNVWIGGTDILKDGTFVWAGKGIDFTFTNWIVAQPSHETQKNCVHQVMWQEGSWDINGWETNDCDSKHYFVCED